jgi:hypothetical protein
MLQGLVMRMGKFRSGVIRGKSDHDQVRESRFVGDEVGREQMSSMTIDDLIERLTEESLYRLLEQIPPPVREKHQAAWDILVTLLQRIQSTSHVASRRRGIWDQMLPSNANYRELAETRPLLFDRLLEDIRSNDNNPHGHDDRSQMRYDDPELEETLETVKAVSTVFKHWSIFVKEASSSPDTRFASQLRSRLQTG